MSIPGLNYKCVRMRTINIAVLIVSLGVLSSCSSTPNKSTNGRDNEGLTSLHRAAGRGDVALIGTLISEGADINALDSKMGVDVLHKAVYSGNPIAIELLLKNGALIDLQSPSNGDTPRRHR